MKLTLQINDKFKEDPGIKELAARGVLMCPPVGEEGYWLFRVPLSDTQAIIGFPKFGLIGIGFEVEDYDWNTNLPSNVDAEDIYDHIKVNKGDNTITKDQCIEAIGMIKRAVDEMRKAKSN